MPRATDNAPQTTCHVPRQRQRPRADLRENRPLRIRGLSAADQLGRTRARDPALDEQRLEERLVDRVGDLRPLRGWPCTSRLACCMHVACCRARLYVARCTRSGARRVGSVRALADGSGDACTGWSCAPRRSEAHRNALRASESGTPPSMHRMPSGLRASAPLRDALAWGCASGLCLGPMRGLLWQCARAHSHAMRCAPAADPV
jgi:hypothetical protein